MQVGVTQENAGDIHGLPPVMSVVVTLVARVMGGRPVVLLAPEQATEAAHGGASVVRAGGQQPREGAAVPAVVLGRRRRVVVPVAAVVAAVAGLLLALDLVLDRVGHRRAGRTAQKRLQFAPVAHLMPDGATCAATDDRRHKALLAILCLSRLAVIVWLRRARCVVLLGGRSVARVGCAVRG